MTCSITGDPLARAHTGPFDLSRPHFVGVGGVAMSGLARLLAASGYQVSGSDIASSPTLSALREVGVKTYVRHHASYVEQATCLVYTTVAQHTPEVTAARTAGIPVLHRAQVLNHIAENCRRLIAVAGSHGKSTTSGMVANALHQLGMSPSQLIGADPDRPLSGAQLGKSDLLVAEADESDRSFLFLRPKIALITNVSDDHPENFATQADVVSAFKLFVDRVVEGGTVIVNADDKGATEVADWAATTRPDLRIVRYGRADGSEYRILRTTGRGWTLTAEVGMPDGKFVAISLPTPVVQHMHNAVAALACAVALGSGPKAAAQAVSTFRGLRRRFEKIGEVGGVTVIDSYADHPNEITADLCAARNLTSGKVLAVFQPSGHQRVFAFAGTMGEILAARADHVMLLDVHGTIPPDTPTSDSALIASRLREGHFTLPIGPGQVALAVDRLAAPGDVVITMGTGDVTTYGPTIIDQLAAREAVTRTA
ncbi:UDP-N-acetylmuramate--L-alanine ligase [Micromonospora sp. NPDC050417]|uniref:UDP-N-acetylmuramate--L-alanine ligase n=1 Tax=Micromonospora sp. NPDC050417 TaxID=3364280 RepID=UPI0037BB628D